MSEVKDGTILTYGPWYVEDGEGERGSNANRNLNERIYAPEGKTLKHKSGELDYFIRNILFMADSDH